MKEASDHEKDGVERTVASSDPPDKDASEEAPTIIGAKLSGKYEVLSVIGQGGMGKLYAGRHVEIGRKVAIKILKRDRGNDEFYLRFKQEAKLAATLSHSNICSVYDIGELEDGTPYMVMDLLEGKNLREILKTEGRLPWRRAINIFSQLCDALTHAHSKSILHRDLKPSNIVIQNEGSNELAKIIDFGIAKSLEADAAAFTASFQNMGTPQYMSPEQCQSRKLDSRSDLYSFGCLMYEVLAGRPPFSSGDSLQAMFAHVNTDPEPLSKIAPESEIPAHLESAVAKAMQKNPDDRFQSASELKKHILGDISPLALERSNSQAHLPSESRRKSQSNSEHKSVIRKAMIPGMVIVTVVVIAVLMMANRDNVMLIIDGRRPGEIYNGDDARALRWKLQTITDPQVHAIYLGQAHDTPRSKDNDETIMGHATVRVTNRTPVVILALASHAQVNWNIVAGPGTRVEKVLVCSTYGRSKVTGVPEDRVKLIQPKETISFYLSDERTPLSQDDAFRQFNKEVAAALGDEVKLGDQPINTFQYAQQLKEFEI